MFTKLSSEQINKKKEYIKNYMKSKNAADGSVFDANANVTDKNLATLSNELYKDFTIQINRSLITEYLEKLFDKKTAKEYIRQIKNHEIYVHDETSLLPYCVSITMYPFLIDGLTKLGGESSAPKHLESFCGSFVNLVFAIASQFAGAVATVEFLMYFDYFARKDYGEYYLKTHKKQIENHIQHVVYALNQPAAARGYQSVFWNISVYDKYYFKGMFEHFVFPDMSKPDWVSVNNLQKFFMKWFNEERKKALLTFPVVTAAALNDGKTYKDQEFLDFISNELAEGNSFFIFTDNSPNALSSCCRLKNDIEDSRNDFSYTLGAGGVATGSLNVITMNINRMIQLGLDIKEQVQKIHKYQIAFRKLFEDYKNAGLLTVYNAGFIDMDKQFLTVGINGVIEAAEFLGYEIGNNEKYKTWVKNLLKTISDENKKASKKWGYKFNTEFVPAENLGYKNAQWDKKEKVYIINGKEYDKNTIFILENGEKKYPYELKLGDEIKEIIVQNSNQKD